VQEAKNQVRIEPDRVYVIPPGKQVSLAENTFKVASFRGKPAPGTAINRFFSLPAK
jgi:chemotaxis response regulator CheB